MKLLLAFWLGVVASLAQSDIELRQKSNDRFLERIRAGVAGRENEPAGQVFRNIRLEGYGDIPVKQFLVVMDIGFSRGLGVTCMHCHAEGDFSRDDKRPKRAAREMVVMLRMISDQLGKMKDLSTAPNERGINCTTCHRGSITPGNAK